MLRGAGEGDGRGVVDFRPPIRSPEVRHGRQGKLQPRRRRHHSKQLISVVKERKNSSQIWKARLRVENAVEKLRDEGNIDACTAYCDISKA